MKQQKVRRSGKGREHRFAMEDLVKMVGERPELRPLYEMWRQFREQNADGNGMVEVGERPYDGDGVFWQTSTKDSHVLFLYSPHRVVKALQGTR